MDEAHLGPLEPTRMSDGEIRAMRQEFMAPTLGRVVLFTPACPENGSNGAREYVAIVGQIFHDPGNSRPYVNLLTFPPFAAPLWEGSVQEGAGPRTWRWPPRGGASASTTGESGHERT